MRKPVVVNGWSISADPLLLQTDELILENERCQSSDPGNRESRNRSKRMKADLKLITDDVPADPTPSPKAKESFGQGL